MSCGTDSCSPATSACGGGGGCVGRAFRNGYADEAPADEEGVERQTPEWSLVQNSWCIPWCEAAQKDALQSRRVAMERGAPMTAPTFRREIHEFAKDAPVLAGLIAFVLLITAPFVLPIVIIAWVLGKAIQKATR